VDGANSAYGAVGLSVQEAPASGGAWESLGSVTQTAPTSGLLGEFAAIAAQNITASWTTTSALFVVGAEIKAASGAGAPTGAASGSWTLTGSASGVTQPFGIASGSFSFAGTAVGGNAPAGSAGGGWSYLGTATGSQLPGATASGTWTFTGTAVGTRVRSGTAAGSWVFSGTGAGLAPGVSDVSHTYGFATLVTSGAAAATLTASVASYTLTGVFPGADTFPSLTQYPGSTADGATTQVNTIALAGLASDGVGAATLAIYSPGLATLQTDR
jgi:hypothetical protein